jgi:hypothetical protein
MGNLLPARYPTGMGPGGDFYPWVRGRVRKFTRYPCRGGHGYALPTPLLSLNASVGNTCFKCGETGHYANNCPQRSAQNTPVQSQQMRTGNKTPQNSNEQQNSAHGILNHINAQTEFGMSLSTLSPHQFYLIILKIFLYLSESRGRDSFKGVVLSHPKISKFQDVNRKENLTMILS